jgi:hypothetical protein
VPNFDDVAEKRTETKKIQQQEAERKQSIEAVYGSGREVVSSTGKLAKSQDIDSLLSQMKEMALAQFMTGQKSTVVLTDQTDLGERFTALGDKLASTISDLDSSDVDNKKLAALTKVSAAIEAFNSTLTSDNKATQKAQAELLKAVNGIDFSPIINVPELTIPKLDLSPIEKVLQAYGPKDVPEPEYKVDLECFKAQDIDNSVENFQYVGFVNPDGQWYIIENDVKKEKLRYVFGTKGYAKAFKKASTYQYMLLNEAIDALST